jgi:salicylate hydroxylase
MTSVSIGIAGGGVGGLAAALALQRMGHRVTVFEQSLAYGRVGADVNLTPNAVRALDGLGIGAALRATAARPTHRISRTWDTGAETSRLEMADAAQARYGAPQLTIHRADLLAALESGLVGDLVRFGQRVVAVGRDEEAAIITLADGTRHDFDVLIGADGIHSAVRAALFGPESPRFTGLVAYRAVVPRSRLSIPNLDAFTKWWGPTPSMQIVTFPLNRGAETFFFATLPQEDWRHESWTMRGELGELHAAYAGFHPEARALLDAGTEVMKSALYVRDPLPAWSSGRITVIGDACHPMVPFMAQGACMAIEDAVVLGRALQGVERADVATALQRYQAARRSRTARVQENSLGNEWLKEGGNADWVYGYDAWTAPLE